MSRRRLSLREPPEDSEVLQGFPRVDLAAETTVWRVTAARHGPWWFSNAMTGRFDLREPEGTCYVAREPLAALLEVLGPDRLDGTVTTELLAGKRLHELRLPERRVCGDLTSRQAAGFGMTLEIHTCTSYRLTQSWASALADAGCRGLVYLARHDPSSSRSVALFGAGGEPAEWPTGRAHPLSDSELLRRLGSECNLQVAPRPRLSQIEVLD